MFTTTVDNAPLSLADTSLTSEEIQQLDAITATNCHRQAMVQGRHNQDPMDLRRYPVVSDVDESTRSRRVCRVSGDRVR